MRFIKENHFLKSSILTIYTIREYIIYSDCVYLTCVAIQMDETEKNRMGLPMCLAQSVTFLLSCYCVIATYNISIQSFYLGPISQKCESNPCLIIFCFESKNTIAVSFIFVLHHYRFNALNEIKEEAIYSQLSIAI